MYNGVLSVVKDLPPKCVQSADLLGKGNLLKKIFFFLGGGGTKTKQVSNMSSFCRIVLLICPFFSKKQNKAM